MAGDHGQWGIRLEGLSREGSSCQPGLQAAGSDTMECYWGKAPSPAQMLSAPNLGKIAARAQALSGRGAGGNTLSVVEVLATNGMTRPASCPTGICSWPCTI